MYNTKRAVPRHRKQSRASSAGQERRIERRTRQESRRLCSLVTCPECGRECEDEHFYAEAEICEYCVGELADYAIERLGCAS